MHTCLAIGTAIRCWFVRLPRATRFVSGLSPSFVDFLSRRAPPAIPDVVSPVSISISTKGGVSGWVLEPFVPGSSLSKRIDLRGSENKTDELLKSLLKFGAQTRRYRPFAFDRPMARRDRYHVTGRGAGWERQHRPYIVLIWVSSKV